MNATSTRPTAPTSVGTYVHDDVRNAGELGSLATRGNVTFDARRGRGNLWIVASISGRESAALRVGHGGDDLESAVGRTDTPDGVVFEVASALGAQRAKVTFPADAQGTVRCTVSVLPARDVAFRSGRAIYTCSAPRWNGAHRAARAAQRDRVRECERSRTVHAVLLLELLVVDGLLRGHETLAGRLRRRPVARARIRASGR